MILPRVEPCAFFVRGKNDFSCTLVSARNKPLDETCRNRVRTDMETTFRKMLANVRKFSVRLFRANLAHPLICSVRFRNESSDVHIALDARLCLQFEHEIDNHLLFCFSFSFRERKTDHKIEFCLFPAAFFCVDDNLFKMLRINFFVQPELPSFFRCLNCKCQSAFSHFRKFFEQRKGKTVHFKRRKLKTHVLRLVFFVQIVEKIFNVRIIRRRKRRKRNFLVASFVYEPVNFVEYDFLRLCTLRPVIDTSMAKTASVRAAAHDFHNSVVVDGLCVRKRHKRRN